MKLIYDIRPPLKIKTTNSSCDMLAEEVLWDTQRIIDLRGTYTLIKEADKIVKEIRKTIDEL